MATSTNSQSDDIINLKSDFMKTFSDLDFELVGETSFQILDNTLSTTYWAPHLVFRKSGLYFFKIEFDYTNTPNTYKGYLEYAIHIGLPGKERQLYTHSSPNGAFPYFRDVGALPGDTVIIPIRMWAHTTNYKCVFKPVEEMQPAVSADLDVNVSFEKELHFLNYIGTSSRTTLTATLNKYVWYTSVFQAKEAGRFILKIDEKEIPIVIHPKNKPIRVIASNYIVMADGSRRPNYKVFSNNLRVGDFLKIDTNLSKNNDDQFSKLEAEVLPFLMNKDGVDFLFGY